MIGFYGVFKCRCNRFLSYNGRKRLWSVFSGRNNEITHNTNVNFPRYISNHVESIVQNFCVLGSLLRARYFINFAKMKVHFSFHSLLFVSLLATACSSVSPEDERKAAYAICACMNEKDKLIVRDTIGMVDEVRMLHYTQCVFDFSTDVDPFKESFNDALKKTCPQLGRLHDAFVQIGTKKKSVSGL
jgi:hypothetical protein